MGRPKSLEREKFWRGLIREQKSSGLSISAFCREREVSVASFFSWRKRLGQRSEPTPAAAQFVAIDLPAAAPFEVRLPNGCRILVPARFDASSLSSIIDVLESESRSC